mgnify:CR=1 FL=1
MAIETFQSSTTERVLAAAGILVSLGGAGLVWFFNPSTEGFFPVCPLFKLTGIACPGCGLTRAFHALFHGDIAAALGFNAMVPFYAFVFAYLFVAMILIAALGRTPRLNILKARYIWSFMIVALVFAVVRNLPYYPFTLLYP